MAFPNVEQIVVTKLGAYLATQIVGFSATNNIGTRTPSDLQDKLTFVRVANGGGPRDHIQGQTRVDIQVFAATYAAGRAVTEQIDTYLTGTKFDWRIDHVTTESGPQEVPWADPNVRSWVASYRAASRRTA
jgi:hypothetical protein